LHLIVVGIGPLSGAVKAGLGDNATLAGLQEPEKLAQFYAAADCLAMASDIEIGGMVSVEALACGCPVLTSAQSGVAQSLGDPTAMLKIESGVEAWADALFNFAQDRALQASMRTAAEVFRQDRVAGWKDVLTEDFIPVWQSVRQKERI
jgi:glycosyltransferase involved in cell wall biosynthesis